MRWLGIYLLCSLILVACQRSHTTEPDKVIRLCENVIETSISHYVSDVDYLVLKPTEKYIVGNVDNVFIKDNRIFVGDYKANRVFVYDMNGELTGVINRHGRGPGEYVQIRKFAVDQRYVYILDNYVNKVLVYDNYDFEFLYEFQIPFKVWDFAVLTNGGFVFAYAPMSGNTKTEASNRYRLFFTDSQLNVQNRMFEYKKGEEDALCFRNYLSYSGSDVVYSSFKEDIIYLFNGENGKPIYSTRIDYENVIPGHLRSDLKSITDEIYTYQYTVPIVCDGYIALNFARGTEGIAYFYNTKRDLPLTDSPFDLGNRVLGVVGSYQNTFIAYWGSSIAYTHLTARGLKKANPDIEKMINQEYPYLIFYQMINN